MWKKSIGKNRNFLKIPLFQVDASTLEPLEWGLCLPDCPSQEVEIVCQDPPPLPALADPAGNPKSVNYTVYGLLPDRDTSKVTPGVSKIRHGKVFVIQGRCTPKLPISNGGKFKI